MADTGDFRARAKAVAAVLDAARRRAGFALPAAGASRLERYRDVLGEWALAEVLPGRLLPWVPVGFGLGIVFYFSAAHEPSLWAAGTLAAAAVTLAVVARHRPVAFPVAVAFATVAVGFLAGTIKTRTVAHPVLAFPVTATVTGFVEVREERTKSDRIVVRVEAVEGRGLHQTLTRVRVAVRKGTAPDVGDYVRLKARLSPPLAPLRPGGYDFARDIYFQNIGASGYALGKITVLAAPASAGFALRFAAVVDGIREAIDDHIRTELDGDRGSIASALITGKRDAISDPVNDAMYISSLGHVLSISGYHMAVVAGIVFFLIRAGMALVPSLAVAYPIKKWAAAVALIAATLYLILSGSEVATQRSYIMIAIVLVGVMFDRAALTFRTLTIAALVVMAIAPQSVVHPSFQMSFAATLALVAAYRYGFPWQANAETSIAARVALWGGREAAALILASAVAGLATTPYVGFHFHRISPYGVLANLLAMPIVSAWVMPMGLLGLVAYPFGFDDVFWRLMGYGIDWMVVVAQWVTGLPGAVGRVAAFGTGPLLLATLGLLVICLLRTRLRWIGAALMTGAAAWVLLYPQPDIYIAANGDAAMIRGVDGRLSVLHRGRDTFAIKEWLAADADARGVKDKSLTQGVRCDEDGCIGTMRGGSLVAMSLTRDAFRDDCSRAAVVVSPHDAPDACAALTFDRHRLRASGAVAVVRHGTALGAALSRPSGEHRPWYGAPAAGREQRGAASRDATPPSASLDADDQ